MLRWFSFYALLFTALYLLTGCGSDAADVNGQPPTKAQTDRYQTMSAGPLSLSVDPEVGARIASFTYEGREILKTSRDENNWQWGSTVWTSPQSDWNWPPPSFDTARYDFSQTGENRMHFYSPIDPATGLQVIKSVRLAIDEARGPLATIRYQIYNRGTEPVEVAVWENTRVPYGGTIYYPSGGQTSLKFEDQPISITENDGMTSLELRAGAQPDRQKIYYVPPTPGRGKYALNVYENNDLVFLKSWEATSNPAPNHTPLEIFLTEQQGFTELEIQGQYRTVRPKEFTDLTVFWQLFPTEDFERQLARFRE
jgi:hypothetical protein